MFFSFLIISSLLFQANSVFICPGISRTHIQNGSTIYREPEVKKSLKLLSQPNEYAYKDDVWNHFFAKYPARVSLGFNTNNNDKLNIFFLEQIPKIKKFLDKLNHQDSSADRLANILLEFWIWESVAEEVSQQIFFAIKEQAEDPHFTDRKVFRLITSISNFRIKRGKSKIWYDFEHLILSHMQEKYKMSGDEEKYKWFLINKVKTRKIMTSLNLVIKTLVKDHFHSQLEVKTKNILSRFKFKIHFKTPNWKDILETAVRMTFVNIQLGSLEIRESEKFKKIQIEYKEIILQHISESQINSLLKNAKINDHHDDPLFKFQKQFITSHLSRI
ncbi:MAG: hypothetical protein AB8G05_08310 [Oligoflexales bacterium]